MKNISLSDYSYTIFTIVSVFILFEIPYRAANIAAIVLHTRVPNVIKLFSLQNSRVNASTGLNIMLALLLISLMISAISSLINIRIQAYNNNKLNNIDICKKSIQSLLGIISLFGVMVTIASLMYANDWTTSTVGFLYRLIQAMSVISYGAISIKSLLG